MTMTKKTSLTFTLTFKGRVNTLPEDGPPMYTADLVDNLEAIIHRALSEGMVTGDSPATLEWQESDVSVRSGYPWMEDYGLSAGDLEAKYSPQGDGEHPDFPREDWREMVRMEDTALGYWAWLEHHIASFDPDNDA